MQKITLYRYIRPDGGTTNTPVKPDCEYTILYRLVADEGKTLTNKKDITFCIDTETPDEWNEIENEEQDITGDEILSMLEEVL